jgi:D-alanyl-D-alanine carboxypeptidase (penicillin-binding protein 5/6)
MVLALNYATITVSASVDEGEIDDVIDMEDSIENTNSLEINAKSAVLMDAETGMVLYTKNAAEALPPASVTKVMTLLLVAEAIDKDMISLEDKILVSANAASMGGSQIFISEGEEFTVEELVKSTVIASANDAAVALAETIAGSESAFVERMNQRAKELGMNNTHFENATGLDDTVVNHVISAYDIALMSRELLKYDIVTDYSNVWQDSIRNGEFILTNTNRLVRYYDGCTGLKTGSTDKAGFCISATAKRDGMHLIAVVMGAETRDERNNAARAMLDFGFSNYGLYSEAESELEPVDVLQGVMDSTMLYTRSFAKLVNKGDKKKIEKEFSIPDFVTAPLSDGDVVGKVVYKLNGEIIGESDVYIRENVPQIKLIDLFGRILKTIFTGK